jgi:PRTRC genetic system protein E
LSFPIREENTDMKFIQTIAPLLAQGMQILFKLSQSGEKVQVDILPTGKENKAGILVPPKSLVGTPEEIARRKAQEQVHSEQAGHSGWQEDAQPGRGRGRR